MQPAETILGFGTRIRSSGVRIWLAYLPALGAGGQKARPNLTATRAVFIQLGGTCRAGIRGFFCRRIYSWDEHFFNASAIPETVGQGATANGIGAYGAKEEFISFTVLPQ